MSAYGRCPPTGGVRSRRFDCTNLFSNESSSALLGSHGTVCLSVILQNVIEVDSFLLIFIGRVEPLKTIIKRLLKWQETEEYRRIG